MSIKLGYATTELPISQDIYLSGYFPVRKCKGIHDPLYIKSNTFYDEQTNTYYFFVAMDIIGLDESLKTQVEKVLFGVVPDSSFHLFLSATHTHSGPVGLIHTDYGYKKALVDIFGEFDKNYIQVICSKIVETIRLSMRNLSDFTYSVYQSWIEGVGLDRQNPKAPIDSCLTLLEFDKKVNQKIGIVNYSCHPTVLSKQNRQVSADYLFEFYNKAEGEFDQISFISGSSANISTRFTRSEQSILQAKIFGKSLYKQLSQRSNTLIEKKILNKIEARNYSFQLKVKDLRDISIEIVKAQIEELTKELEVCQTSTEKRLLNANIEGLRSTVQMKEALRDIQEIELHYSIVQFDQLFFILLPVEISSELTKMIRQKYKCLVFSLVNDYLFYLVEEEKYVDNTYEAQSSFFKKGQAEKFMRIIDEQLKNFA